MRSHVFGALPFFLAIAVILISCSGKRIFIAQDPNLLQSIQVGRTTKAEVEAILGQPSATSHRQGLEVWRYSAFTKNREYHLALIFSGSGTVDLGVSHDLAGC
jgi:outer membrane protein assembly factor BamE (lipoprotein component of BamABCDE complex)